MSFIFYFYDLVTEMTSQKVDSDLRTLFAIGKLDDFEKLKKECSESAIVLKGIEARIQERLKIFRNMSPREVSPIGTCLQRFHISSSMVVVIHSVLCW